MQKSAAFKNKTMQIIAPLRTELEARMTARKNGLQKGFGSVDGAGDLGDTFFLYCGTCSIHVFRICENVGLGSSRISLVSKPRRKYSASSNLFRQRMPTMGLIGGGPLLTRAGFRLENLGVESAARRLRNRHNSRGPVLLASRRGTNTVIEHHEKKLSRGIKKRLCMVRLLPSPCHHDSTRDVIRILSDMS